MVGGVCGTTCSSSVFRLLIWMSGVIKEGSVTRDGWSVGGGGTNRAVFTHPSRSPRGHIYEPLRNKTPDSGPSLSRTAKQKKRTETRLTVSKYASNDNIRDIKKKRGTMTFRPDPQAIFWNATVLQSLYMSILNRWLRWLTFPDVRLCYLFPACVGDHGERQIDLLFRKASVRVPRERQSHLTTDQQSLSLPFLCYRSSCVCKFIDKTTLYTMCVYAGINQKCRHRSWLRKWSRIIKREDLSFFSQFRFFIYWLATSYQIWGKCVLILLKIC